MGEEQERKGCLQSRLRQSQEVQERTEDLEVGFRLQAGPSCPRYQGILPLRWKVPSRTGAPQEDPLLLQEMSDFLSLSDGRTSSFDVLSSRCRRTNCHTFLYALAV